MTATRDVMGALAPALGQRQAPSHPANRDGNHAPRLARLFAIARWLGFVGIGPEAMMGGWFVLLVVCLLLQRSG